AGVQAPAIYRLFGDKRGLLEAVAERGLERYVQEKSVREAGPDPVADLRAGWDLHIGFGLANPAIYGLMYGDPRPGTVSRAAAAGLEVLERHVHRIAAAGRLRVSERRAVDLLHAAGLGTVLALLAMPEDARDLALSDMAREAVLAAITTDSPVLESPSPATAAIALRAALPDATPLSEGERHLLDEWLDRLAADRA
ncbi:MAG TPA: TetR/AcrR family transcriptional regulator, partial [Solirubrobacter sp.]